VQHANFGACKTAFDGAQNDSESVDGFPKVNITLSITLSINMIYVHGLCGQNMKIYYII
jgi:hypothetical protein